MTYAFEMGSGAMIYPYIPSFIMIGSGIQTMLCRIHRHRQHDDIMNLHLFFQNKGNRLRSMREYLSVCTSYWSTLNKMIEIGKNLSTCISATPTEVIAKFLSPSRLVLI
jgi:hypothetical protein